MRRLVKNGKSKKKTQLDQIEEKIDTLSLTSWFFFGFAFLAGAIALNHILGFVLTLLVALFGLVLMVVVFVRIIQRFNSR